MMADEAASAGDEYSMHVNSPVEVPVKRRG